MPSFHMLKGPLSKGLPLEKVQTERYGDRAAAFEDFLPKNLSENFQTKAKLIVSSTHRLNFVLYCCGLIWINLFGSLKSFVFDCVTFGMHFKLKSSVIWLRNPLQVFNCVCLMFDSLGDLSLTLEDPSLFKRPVQEEISRERPAKSQFTEFTAPSRG